MSIEEYLRHLTADEVKAREAIERALGSGCIFRRHPLGFISTVIAKDDLRNLRLHIWPRGRSIRQQPYFGIHNHTFHLHSWVLAGAVTNLTYNLLSNRQEKRLYSVAYDDLHSCLHSTSTLVGIELEQTTSYNVGENYTLEAGVFHESRILHDMLTVTCVLATGSHCGAPKVVGPVAGSRCYEYARSPVETEQIVRLLSEI